MLAAALTTCAPFEKQVPREPTSFFFEGGLTCDETYRCVITSESDVRMHARFKFVRASDGVCRTDGAYVDEAAGVLRPQHGPAVAIRSDASAPGPMWFCSQE
jgi:hypothetical protein